MDERSRILIVDDEPDARDILEALLYREGYELASAGSGPEALACVEEFAPDAILLDVMMPGMDGFEVCRRLRADPVRGEVPVLLVTALDDRDSRLRGIEAGADDFITKPVDRVELRTRVKTITQLNRYRRLLWERSRRQEAEEEMLRRNRELTLLNQVITAAASTFDVRQVLEIACRALADAFDLPKAIATLVRQDTSAIDAASKAGSPDPRLAVVAGYWRGSRCQREKPAEYPFLSPFSIGKTPLAVVDAQNDPVLAHAREQICEQGIVSVLLVPIVVRDGIAGSIELSTMERQDFSDPDLTLAQSIATAVGQAMENSRLYRELQRHARELEETIAQRTVELRVERDRTQAILEALGEAVIVTDVKGKIQYVNPAAVTLTGYSGQELLGRKWRPWQDASLPRGFYDQMEEFLSTGQKWCSETAYKRKDGTLYEAAITVAPLCEPHDSEKLVGFVGVQRDITPIKRAERLKDQLISNVSHELRTPLSVITLISGNLDTLYDRLSEHKRRQLIRDIREHIRVLNQVIDDVLEISQIDSERISMERKAVNLAQLAREEAAKQLPLAERKSQILRVGGLKHLPVWGNEAQLRQVIRNLLNNAIKYTPEGGEVTCEGSAPAEKAIPRAPEQPTADSLPSCRWAALRVADTGIGIEQEDLPHLFERFFRVEAQGSIPGTGLGLAIARELAEIHGGHLTVTSSPGEGSVFTLFLPLFEEEECLLKK